MASTPTPWLQKPPRHGTSRSDTERGRTPRPNNLNQKCNALHHTQRPPPKAAPRIGVGENASPGKCAKSRPVARGKMDPVADAHHGFFRYRERECLSFFRRAGMFNVHPYFRGRRSQFLNRAVRPWSAFSLTESLLVSLVARAIPGDPELRRPKRPGHPAIRGG